MQGPAVINRNLEREHDFTRYLNVRTALPAPTVCSSRIKNRKASPCKTISYFFRFLCLNSRTERAVKRVNEATVATAGTKHRIVFVSASVLFGGAGSLVAAVWDDSSM